MNIICILSITNNILQHFPTQITALHLAAIYNPAAVPVLLEANAEVNLLDSDKVKLDFMRYEYSTFSFTIVTLRPFPTQQTALHLAAYYNPAAVPVLLEANAEVNVVDGSNRSPLFDAAENNHREAVIALCVAGADPHLGDPSPLTVSWISEDMKNLIREQLS